MTVELFACSVGVCSLFTCCYVVCEHYYVPSLCWIGNRLGLSADLQGATLLAIGSSTPELFTSLISIYLYNDIGLNPGPSTIVGSSMYNLSVITGMSCLFINGKDNISGISMNIYAIYRDIFCFMISVMALHIFYDHISPNEISGFEGLALLSIWIFYIFVLITFNDKINKYNVDSIDSNKNGDKSSSNNSGNNNDDIMDIVELMHQTDKVNKVNKRKRDKATQFFISLFNMMQLRPIHFLFSKIFPSNIIQFDTSQLDKMDKLDDLNEIVTCNSNDANKKNVNKNEFELLVNGILIFILSIIYLAMITFCLLHLVSYIGRYYSISVSIMGMTVVAIGSSLPDTISSIVLAKQGKFDMIFSNCFSSNIFNIGFVLGITFTLKILYLNWQDIKIDNKNSHALMMIQIIAVTVFFALIHCSKIKLYQWHGFVLLSIYALFIYLFAI